MIKWLHKVGQKRRCTLGDHAIVSVIKNINGRYTHVQDYCSACGRRVALPEQGVYTSSALTSKLGADDAKT
jgi:rRNA maturation protein Nop10